MNINSVTNKFDALCSIFKQKADILLVYETKVDDIFLLAQFCVERYSTLFKLGRTKEGGYCCMQRMIYLQNKLI